jgi:IS605 OrfB family transposase
MYLTTVNKLKLSQNDSTYLKSQIDSATEFHDYLIQDFLFNIHNVMFNINNYRYNSPWYHDEEPLALSPLRNVELIVKKKFIAYYKKLDLHPEYNPPVSIIFFPSIHNNIYLKDEEFKSLDKPLQNYLNLLREPNSVKPPLCFLPLGKTVPLIFNKSSFKINEVNTIYFYDVEKKVKSVLPFSIPLPKHLTNKDVDQIRISYMNSELFVHYLYKKPVLKSREPIINSFLSIDIGLKNLCTMINNVNNKPIIVDGKQLRTYLHQYNQKKKKYKETLMRLNQTPNTKRMEQMNQKKSMYVKNYLHQVSNYIIKYCKEHGIEKIIVGYNKGMKEQLRKTSTYQGIFFQIPYSKLIHYLEYKSKLNHIDFIIQEESYTSLCDSLALENIKNKKVYSGTRLHRGLYKSSTGKLINADVNAAINIARKAIGKSIDPWVKELAKSGIVSIPLRVTI